MGVDAVIHSVKRPNLWLPGDDLGHERDFARCQVHPWRKLPIDNRRFIQKWGQVKCDCCGVTVVCNPCAGELANNYMPTVITGAAKIPDPNCTLCLYLGSMTTYYDAETCEYASGAGPPNSCDGYYYNQSRTLRLLLQGGLYYWELVEFLYRVVYPSIGQTVTYLSETYATKPPCDEQYALTLNSQESTLDICDFSVSSATIGPGN